MTDQPSLDRMKEESEEEYLNRLNRMDTQDWSVDDVMARTLLLRDLQRTLASRVNGSRNGSHGPDALQNLKLQIRNLSDQQRRQLASWIACGMPAQR